MRPCLTDFSRRGFVVSALAGAGSLLASPPLRAADETLRFEHAYGETVLDAPARRVVSLGYTTQDSLLALGVVPQAIRYWYGEHPHGVWPWAQPLLGDASPALMTGEVSIETVASLAPDLIVAIGSGISEAEYALLSQIAPVLMQAPGHSAYGMPWDAELRMIARATGTEAKAEALITGVQDRFAALRDRHPEWQGQTAACAWHEGGQTSAFTGGDARVQFFQEMGFQQPPALAALNSADGFYTALSPEDLSPLDADLLIWISTRDQATDIAGLAMRRTLRANAEGREVFCGELIAGALSFGSVLSMPFALEQLEPEIIAALDGDPATPVPSAQDAGLL